MSAWQSCDDCGATLLVTIPYDGRSLCHTCWEDAKRDSCGTGGPMGDNQTGSEPTTVNVSIELFEQEPMQAIGSKLCKSCRIVITNSSSSGGLCPLCGKRMMMRYTKKHMASSQRQEVQT